jgi:hypothetical protein
MRLHQTVIFENEFTPGAPAHTTQLVDLTLKEIVDAGKITNPYQLFVLGRVASFFKMGYKSVDLQLENPVNYGDESTTTAYKEAMLAMSSADHVKLASYLLDCIQVGESMLHDCECHSVVDWMKFVLAKQK